MGKKSKVNNTESKKIRKNTEQKTSMKLPSLIKAF